MVADGVVAVAGERVPGVAVWGRGAVEAGEVAELYDEVDAAGACRVDECLHALQSARHVGGVKIRCDGESQRLLRAGARDGSGGEQQCCKSFSDVHISYV